MLQMTPMINVDAQRFDYRRCSPSSTGHIPVEHNCFMSFVDSFVFWSGTSEMRVRRVTFGSGISCMLLCMYVNLVYLGTDFVVYLDVSRILLG
jgi:hypothetical protein